VVVLLALAATTQALTLMWDAYDNVPPFLVRVTHLDTGYHRYLYAALGLAIASIVLAAALRAGHQLGLLLAALYYPFTAAALIETYFHRFPGPQNVLVSTHPATLAELYLPTLVAACWAVLMASAPLRARWRPATPDSTGLA
jgi:hypothetical protein